MTPGTRLRDALSGGELLLLPGAYDGLSARILADNGFDAVYATGAGMVNAGWAWPDVGLLGMSEVVAAAGRVVGGAGDVPVVVDADTGYGGPLNVARTVRELERAGAAGIQIEDQVAPKRCGHFTGTEVVDTEEMLGRLRSAQRARQDPSTVLVARTDATASLGLDEAIRRGRLLADAGADVVFVEAPRTVDELARIPLEIPAPTLVNVVEGGHTPQLPASGYSDMGFRVALYANTALRLAAQAVQSGTRLLRRDVSSHRLENQVLSWAERQRLVRRDEYDAWAARLQAGDTENGPPGSVDEQEAGTA